MPPPLLLQKALLEGIGIAEELGLANHRLPEVGELVQEATLVLGKIERCKAALAQAMANVEEELLSDALALCDDTGYSSLQVDQARDLLTLIRDLTERAVRRTVCGVIVAVVSVMGDG